MIKIQIYARQKLVEDQIYTLAERKIRTHMGPLDWTNLMLGSKLSKINENGDIVYGLYDSINHEVILEPIFTELTHTCFQESWFATYQDQYYVLGNNGEIILQSFFPITCSFGLHQNGGVYVIFTDKETQIYSREGKLLGCCLSNSINIDEMQQKVTTEYISKREKFFNANNKIIQAIPNMTDLAISVEDPELRLHYVQIVKDYEEYLDYQDDLLTLSEERQYIIQKR